MNVPLSLWFVLLMSTCCGGDESSTTDYYYYDDNPTATPDYDYNATFNYYFANCSVSGDCVISAVSDIDNAAAAIEITGM
ncbi:hypothetical protein JOB18_012461 [Solea senegalensis]|uniref:Uncharacterized protein n=1 Tax=Solea senegalensis TaxID=28829 RepID=A0AAV6PTK8_SOLSE|nr:hypothetical protein JOB18_012461 [Solea senegalensis]